jgi:hypothetical protein
MDRKYYYYVAILSRGSNMIHVKGTFNTTLNDIPLKEVEKHVIENVKLPIDSIVISFYKEITRENYESYNNEQ